MVGKDGTTYFFSDFDVGWSFMEFSSLLLIS